MNGSLRIPADQRGGRRILHRQTGEHRAIAIVAGNRKHNIIGFVLALFVACTVTQFVIAAGTSSAVWLFASTSGQYPGKIVLFAWISTNFRGKQL
eukprot:3879210-Rhodomonas_salina.2